MMKHQEIVVETDGSRANDVVAAFTQGVVFVIYSIVQKPESDQVVIELRSVGTLSHLGYTPHKEDAHDHD